MVGGANGRLESLRTRGAALGGPSCLLPTGPSATIGPVLEESLEQISSRLLGILALAWQVPAEEVRREMERQHEQSREGEPPAARTRENVVSLDGWRRRPRRRLRVDRRTRRPGAQRRGGAA